MCPGAHCLRHRLGRAQLRAVRRAQLASAWQFDTQASPRCASSLITGVCWMSDQGCACILLRMQVTWIRVCSKTWTCVAKLSALRCRRTLVMAGVSLCMSAVWLSAVADEVVALLQALGHVLGITTVRPAPHPWHKPVPLRSRPAQPECESVKHISG